MFQEEIEQQVACKRISNLRAAKHRFESLATPMGRTLLYLASFVACCQRVAETRADTSMGKQTKVFLEDLTAEKLVHLGLLADAFDEALMLLTEQSTHLEFDMSTLKNFHISTIPLSARIAFVNEIEFLNQGTTGFCNRKLLIFFFETFLEGKMIE